MKDYIMRRVTDIAEYLISTRCTVREAATVYCVSKSTAHKDLNERLAQINPALYRATKTILQGNWNERYIRGGNATKNKYRNAARRNNDIRKR